MLEIDKSYEDLEERFKFGMNFFARKHSMCYQDALK